MSLRDIDALLDECCRVDLVRPAALVMSPSAMRAWTSLVVALGGRLPEREPIPTYAGIPIIVVGSVDDPCLVGALQRTALHGQPIRVVAFADPP
ncbi:MAG: hypothetical protein IT374_26435 [Polyangiaceae bacterium]|nr:hypothetical protein [Polyangiaceae bacterium]